VDYPFPTYDSFMQFVYQLDPSIVARLGSGASLPDVEQLERYSRYRFPRLYRDYLLHCGGGNCGLAIGSDGSSDVPSLLTFYSEQQRLGYPDVPTNCIAIADLGVTGMGTALYLDDGNAEPVVTYSLGEVCDTLATSFSNHLCGAAFTLSRFGNRFPAAFLRSDRLAFREIIQIAPSLNLFVYPFSDQFQASLERNDIAFRLLLSEIGTVAYCQSRKGDVPHDVAHQLTGVLGMRYQPLDEA
jgi:hypothetical protein